MPASPPTRSVPDVENKLRLLYCVAALEQVSEEQLWPFIASLDLMDYLSMQLLLHDLIDSGVMTIGQQAFEGMLTLSPQGKEVLDMFSNRIMFSDKQRITKAAIGYRSELKGHKQVQAVYEAALEGQYRVLLSLQDGEIPTLTIRLTTAVREYAAYSLHAFEKSVSTILLTLYNLAMEPENDMEPSTSPPALTTHSPHEHTLLALLATEDVAFEVTLLLPDVESAINLHQILTDRKAQKKAAKRLFSMLCVKGP